jgi:hypothetical protein
MIKSLRKELGYDKYDEILPNRKIKKEDKENKLKVENEIKEFGYPLSETWSMDVTSAIWLLEHLVMYLDIASKIVNLDFHKFKIPILKPIESVNKNDKTTKKVNKTKKNNLNADIVSIDDNDNKDLMETSDLYKRNFYTEEIVELTQKEAIKTMIDYLKFGLMKDKKTIKTMMDVKIESDSILATEQVQFEKLQQAFKIYSVVLPAMWW